MNSFVLTLKDNWLRLPFNQSEVRLNSNDNFDFILEGSSITFSYGPSRAVFFEFCDVLMSRDGPSWGCQITDQVCFLFYGSPQLPLLIQLDLPV